MTKRKKNVGTWIAGKLITTNLLFFTLVSQIVFFTVFLKWCYFFKRKLFGSESTYIVYGAAVLFWRESKYLEMLMGKLSKPTSRPRFSFVAKGNRRLRRLGLQPPTAAAPAELMCRLQRAMLQLKTTQS